MTRNPAWGKWNTDNHDWHEALQVTDPHDVEESVLLKVDAERNHARAIFISEPSKREHEAYVVAGERALAAAVAKQASQREYRERTERLQREWREKGEQRRQAAVARAEELKADVYTGEIRVSVVFDRAADGSLDFTRARFVVSDGAPVLDASVRAAIIQQIREHMGAA